MVSAGTFLLTATLAFGGVNTSGATTQHAPILPDPVPTSSGVQAGGECELLLAPLYCMMCFVDME